MDKRAMRERMRRKQRQIRRRKLIKLATYVVGAVLAMVFVIRGVIIPIASRIGGGRSGGEIRQEVQAEPVAADPTAAIRQPLKGAGDTGKVSVLTPGWHEDESGRWYQNADGTYFAGGFQELNGVKYAFDDSGYIQTGWVSKGVNDYYFNEDGSYNAEKKRTLLALTLDDGPGQYTDMLLDCLEENGAKATFFMLGENVGNYPETVKRMADMGCEIGSHSWNHPNLTELDLDSVARQFADTDDALIQACGQAATVARAPGGAWSSDIIATAGKPFFTWSLDTLDWQTRDEDSNYNAVINGDLTDGSIILMHDIHEPSVKSLLKIIPELVSRGYKLVTLSEMAEAKNVNLQLASYSDFWPSSLQNGIVAGYNGGAEESSDGSTDSGEGEGSDGSEDGFESESSDGSEDGFEDGYSDEGEEEFDDGSSL